MSTEICIVGAGIFGLSVAYELARAGKKVVVIEGRMRGSGQTGRTTAHIMEWIDDFYYEVENKFGVDKAKIAAQAQRKAVDHIGEIVQEEKIDCDYVKVKGYLFPHTSSLSASRTLDKEFNMTQKLGMDTQKVDLGGGPEVGGITTAVEFPNCANFDPLKYINGLAHVIVDKYGGKIFEMSRVKEVNGQGEVITTHGPVIKASQAVILCTHGPINRNMAIHTRQESSRTYAIGIEVPKGCVQQGQYWDTNSPYHYVRTAPHTDTHDVLIVGGEDHRTGQAPDKYRDSWGVLEQWTRQRWTQAGDVVYRWSGQVYEPFDYLHLIGEDPIQLGGKVQMYMATGDSGQGMTGAAIAGLLLKDMILKIPNPWEDIFTLKRIWSTVSQVADLAQETVFNVEGYASLLTPRSAKDIQGIFSPASVEASLKAGDGAVVQEGVQKVALYRDEDGTLHRMSAVCPHLGCLVSWNPNDKTFDCVCHGSYFDKHGVCIQGPATLDLEDLGTRK